MQDNLEYLQYNTSGYCFMDIQLEIIPLSTFDDALQDWRSKIITIKANQKNFEKHAFPESSLDQERKRKYYLVNRLASVINNNL